ncbi:glutathione S-transferase family protein [Erythrobacter sp. HL-111]|uniref:glutathione S-transferase family protein n=1 Tax=Erythrobacter sp. HL-111 TaxID=1798193 RepID=UPI0006D99A70|nr:glutathione S-transferase family protein [Erythrobacter sp. HL-111]KPP92548.1 MAG: glutathione S-transferase [Erythrobacteraceae bacterium HL-111]SDS91459.1 Glutathione S-transferase [Erythrobacter sp. HL-111]
MTDTARPDLVIYGSPVSPFVRKVAAVLVEKDVPYEIEQVNVFAPPQWFRDISPMKRIPVLRDRSVAEEGVEGTIPDSSAICTYIEAKHPAPALYPADPLARARAVWIEEYADTALAPAGGLGIFRPIFFAVSKGEEPDLARARESWAKDMPPVLDYLDAALEGRAFFAGDALSIADISVTTILMQVALVAHLPLDSWPALSAHYEAMRERPSIAGSFEDADRFVRKALQGRFDLT